MMGEQQEGSFTEQQLSMSHVMCASLAALIVGGPLLGMMGLAFFASLALLVIASPLLLIFSPLIIGAVFVLGAAVVSFASAGGMAVAGMWALSWVFRYVRVRGPAVGEWVRRSLRETRKRVKEGTSEFGGYLEHQVQVRPLENMDRSRG